MQGLSVTMHDCMSLRNCKRTSAFPSPPLLRSRSPAILWGQNTEPCLFVPSTSSTHVHPVKCFVESTARSLVNRGKNLNSEFSAQPEINWFENDLFSLGRPTNRRTSSDVRWAWQLPAEDHKFSHDTSARVYVERKPLRYNDWWWCWWWWGLGAGNIIETDYCGDMYVGGATKIKLLC